MKLSPAARVSNKGWMVGCAKSTRVPPMRRSIQFSNQWWSGAMAVQRAAVSSAMPEVFTLNLTLPSPVRKASLSAAWYAGLMPCMTNADTRPAFMSFTSCANAASSPAKRPSPLYLTVVPSAPRAVLMAAATSWASTSLAPATTNPALPAFFKSAAAAFTVADTWSLKPLTAAPPTMALWSAANTLFCSEGFTMVRASAFVPVKLMTVSKA